MIETRLYRTTSTEYHADKFGPSLSSSIANVLDKEAPLHAWTRHPKLGGVAREDTDTFDAGSLIHALLLGEGKEVAIIQADDWRTKVARDLRAIARAQGRIPVLEHIYAEAAATAKKLRASFAAQGIVLDGESEIAALWGEPSSRGPVQCRGMLDHWRPATSTIYDLKSCRSADPTSIQKSCDRYGYDIQSAAYMSAIETIHPELAGRVEFVLVFFELEAPYAVTPVRLSGAFQELGQRRWKRAVETWARCTATGRWPSYVDGVAIVDPPPWAFDQDLVREERDYREQRRAS